ncbi:uncharacterized protein LOC135392658 [Ornithodoros turicata]|uniref:uncharacterized protein LOC135392658 n=1 Tax=Ornithodoros turicata TaxID=34597 RepID=UPI003139D0CB
MCNPFMLSLFCAASSTLLLTGASTLETRRRRRSLIPPSLELSKHRELDIYLESYQNASKMIEAAGSGRYFLVFSTGDVHEEDNCSSTKAIFTETHKRSGFFEHSSWKPTDESYNVQRLNYSISLRQSQGYKVHNEILETPHVQSAKTNLYHVIYAEYGKCNVLRADSHGGGCLLWMSMTTLNRPNTLDRRPCEFAFDSYCAHKKVRHFVRGCLNALQGD